jgi:1-acyl-sn-glycerol-3-phosphate acyltransferase
MSRDALYRPFVSAVRVAVLAKGWQRLTSGAEHVPRTGPVVLAGNHVSEMDPVIVGLALDELGRRPRFLAKAELFSTPVLGSVLRSARQIPVDRGGDTSTTLPRALLALEAGEAVVVFPEGTVSKAFVPAEARLGAARLALASGAPLVPFATWGGQRVGNPERPTSRGDRIAMVARFGPAVPVEADDSAAALTVRLWDRVGSMLDDLQRTYPQQPADEDDRWWLPRHLGGTAPDPAEAALERRRRAEERAARRRAERDR